MWESWELAQGLPLTWARFWGNWLREDGETGSSVKWGERWCPSRGISVSYCCITNHLQFLTPIRKFQGLEAIFQELGTKARPIFGQSQVLYYTTLKFEKVWLRKRGGILLLSPQTPLPLGKLRIELHTNRLSLHGCYFFPPAPFTRLQSRVSSVFLLHGPPPASLVRPVDFYSE